MLGVLEVVGAVILVLLTVVLVHEGGHFVVAKLSGVRVDEFAVGFGPRLLARQWGETTYSLRLIPAGGYVRMAGMLGLEGEADAGERNFYRASIPKRLATILAGITANLVFAGLLYSVLFMLPTGSQIEPAMAAQRAGLQNGDVIVSVDGRPIRHDNVNDVSDDLHAATAGSKGAPMQVVFTRDGTTHRARIAPSLTVINGIAPTVPPSGGGAGGAVTSLATLPVGLEFVVTSVDAGPVPTGDPATILGGRRISITSSLAPRTGARTEAAGTVQVSGFVINGDGTVGATYQNLVCAGVTDGAGAADAIQAAWRLGITPNYDGQSLAPALGDGFGKIPSFITETYQGIASIVSNPNSGGLNGPQGLSGPVGIVRQTATVTHQGGRSLAEWIAFISLNLGLVNVLPIPFLDGGKAVLILIEAVRRRRLDPRHEALIYAVGLAIVVVFIIYVTIGDVGRSQ